MSTKWPRGRYNGRRITGVKILFRINILCWQWKFRGYNNDPIICVGPFIWNFETNYHYRTRDEEITRDETRRRFISTVGTCGTCDHYSDGCCMNGTVHEVDKNELNGCWVAAPSNKRGAKQ